MTLLPLSLLGIGAALLAWQLAGVFLMVGRWLAYLWAVRHNSRSAHIAIAKRAGLLLLVLLLAMAGRLSAQTVAITEGSFDNEPLVVSTTAIGFTASKYAPTAQRPAVLAIFVVEGCAVRVWPTGNAPTATVGQKLNIGDVVNVSGRDIVNFKAIRDTSCSVDATLQTVYSR